MGVEKELQNAKILTIFKPAEQDGGAAESEILWLLRSSLGPRNRHSIGSENTNRKWIRIGLKNMNKT